MSKQGNIVILRFAASQRIEHILLMVPSACCASLGCRRGTAAAGWAHAILGVFRPQQARTVHHFLCRGTDCRALHHAVVVVCELILVRPPDSDAPRRARRRATALASVAFLLGLRTEKPRYDRYDFRQKVDTGR